MSVSKNKPTNQKLFVGGLKCINYSAGCDTAY